MLSVQDMSTITKEILLGLPPSNTSREADNYRKVVAEELAQMRKDGISPELPYDFD